MAAQIWPELQELRLLSSFDIRVRETRSQILDLEADQRDRCIRHQDLESFQALGLLHRSRKSPDFKMSQAISARRSDPGAILTIAFLCRSISAARDPPVRRNQRMLFTGAEPILAAGQI